MGIPTSVGRRPLFPVLAAAVLTLLLGGNALGAPLALSDVPVFLNATNAEPLVMLALANDEQLYHKAYTDFDDVDGDGVIDSTYKDTIGYYGYFDPTKCYSYSGDTPSGYFVPTALAGGANGHSCNAVSGGGRWSGNFLNWASMARVDALRKVLFGGYRSTDTSGLTILERTYLPNDNHAWAKFYAASDLNQYTPYDLVTYPSGISICNVTPQGGGANNSEANTTSPRLRVANGQWTEWAAQESKQCLWQGEVEGTLSPWASIDANASPAAAGASFVGEFTVRVQACVAGLLGAEKCKAYGTSAKPVGLLQDFADADQLKIRFGLITGTYGKRKSGGMLRKNIARFTDEVNSADGTFTGVDGIVKSINLLRISRYYYSQPGYFGTSPDNCPYGENHWTNGSCSNWGNPLGEIYLEALRYFVGTVSPSSAFASTDSTWIPGLNSVSWVNPYGAASTNPAGGGASVCSKPNILPISTSVLSFDNDDYGGVSDLPGLSLNSQTDAVGSNEGITGSRWFVGSLGGGTTGGGAPTDVCTAQTVGSLSAVTGICPSAGGLQGSFAIAGLAYYAHQKSTALQTVAGRKIPPVDTYAVGLAPPFPALRIPVGNTTVTLQPAAYNYRDSNAMQLINFRVISQAADNSSGLYFMNFENAPAGSDYDNDHKGYLQYTVTGTTIKVVVYQSGSSSGATQMMGYTISGVVDSGTYYLVSNNTMSSAATTPPGQGGGTWSATPMASVDAACLAAGFAATPATVTSEECYYATSGSNGPGRIAYNRGVKSHTAGGAVTGQLQSPLWYAAKYGGFKDIDGDGSPSRTAEWDANGDGIPDNYFPVTNPSRLESQLSNAFNAILAHAGSASAASVNSGSISSTTRIYQATFDTSSWGGHLFAFPINTNGSLGTTPSWDAASRLPVPGSRVIFTTDGNGTVIPFEWANLSVTEQNQLHPSDSATVGQQRLSYLRGDQSKEQAQGGPFRNRDSPLGDIVNSAPAYVGRPNARYSDNIQPSAPYSAFRAANVGRTPMVYVGANDGMLHAFSASANATLPDPASAGVEQFAFIPTAVFANLYQLSNPSYTHLYYDDGTPAVGDAYYGASWHTTLVSGLNKGGREVYALDVTNPTNITESNAGSYLLWEFTSSQDADLGYTYSRPSIVKMHNGIWAAVFGNGYNSTNTGHAILYVLNLQTGAVMAKIDTIAGTAATPNGLSTPFPADVDGDGVVDYIYAGDLQGNLWKFDVTSGSPANWKVAYGTAAAPVPLYIAQDASGNTQPITERPVVGAGPGTSFIVLFGTGELLQPSDRNVDTTHPLVQSFYGILDANTGGASDTFTGRASLQQQSIIAEQSVVVPTLQPNGSTVNQTETVRAISKNSVDFSSQRGWYLDLVSPLNGYEAERSISDPVLRAGEIIFTTAIPSSDPCAYGGRSWLLDMDAMSGGQLAFTPLDLNNDKKFNDADLITIVVDGSTVKVPASAIQTGNGISTAPGLVSGGALDYGYTSGSGSLGIGSNPDGSCPPGGTNCGQGQGIQPYPGAYGRQSWRQLR